MKLKDLFKSTKTIKSSGLDEVAQEVESQEYIKSYNEDKTRFMPNVDYSDPKNFAFYGSAEKYYTDAFVRIKNTYPYDGSEKEKYDWLNDSSFIDSYIFEHRYPRFNGFVNLGYPTWGTLSGSLIDGYGKSNTNTYIKTFGGPNESNKSGLIKQFDHANKYATASLDNTGSTPNGQFRESNLNYNLSGGVTIEMWLKKPAFDTAKTQKEVLFDLWNGEASSSAQYGRLRLELTGASSGSPFLLTAMSGTSGVQNQSLGTNLTTGSISDWTHVAVTLKNSGSHIDSNIYINGALNKRESLSNAALGQVTGSLISFIGALQTAPSGSPTIQTGAGKFSGSLDEFRYWKTERSSKDIGRYYWTNIGAGTNTDEANTDLGVYYKFNEGITTVATTDSTVLDYSGRMSNGAWTGYQSGARSTESAIVLSNAAPKEFKDPTIYSAHPDYISTKRILEASGNLHDIENNASLINSMPSWILEEDDEKEGNLRNITQAMASYFDNLYLHIQEINSLKDVYAHFQTHTINDDNMTSITGSTKPLPFADRLLTNAGFVAPELFADATVLESLAARSEDESYEMKLHDVKNQIYQNVYSSLINVYKRKGTNKGFRNILHSFGIDEDIVSINFYGDNVDFELNDRHTIRTTKQKFVDFNHPDRFAGSVYQFDSGSNGINFITGSASEFEKYIPVTFETQVILPNKIPWNEVNGFETPHTKSVIAGIHQASDATEYTIPATDNCAIQMYTERDEKESKNVEFHLSSSALGIHLSSSLYPNMYDNNEWLLAFRITNDKEPTVDLVSGSSDGSNYTIDFLGYNTEGTTLLNSFHASASVTLADAQNFLINSKRIYAGAKRTNFTGSLEERSDHKIGFVRYWMNDLSNDTLLKHSYDSSNYGAQSPFRSAFLMEDSINDIKIPEIDTLLLHWDFEKLSSTDASGEFIAEDITSGSGEQRYASDFETVKRKFYHAKGDFFLASDEKVIDVVYINAAKITFPDVLQGDDMIEIRTQDDLQFTRNTLPQDYFIAFEKSMSQTISKEMLKFMSSVTDFNNLIGRQVDRYRIEYKDLAKLRQLFFERVANEPDLDKYIDYYKWLDDALGEMLVALVPASLAHSDGINNVVENHVFSRDKYENKFPTIEFKVPDLEGGMNTINRHLYPWKTGHAPIPAQEDDNCFWWLERAERDKAPLSGSDAGNNNTRVKVFQARNSVLNRSFTTAQHFAVDRSRDLHGGTNYEPNKKRDYIWSATKKIGESPLQYGKFGGMPLRYILANNDMFQALKDCNDETPVTTKLKRAFGAIDGFNLFHHTQDGSHHDGTFKGGMVMPFNIMSSSALAGYSQAIEGLPGAGEDIDVVNVHSDTVDGTNAIPMQSPFTERWVGGHQHRHAPLNRGSDNEQTRAEGYRILINNIENNSGSIGIASPNYPYPYSNFENPPHFRVDQAAARYFREERAKRPVNIKNIETTGSQIGNYSKKYEYVHTFGRGVQKSILRDKATANPQLHNATNVNLPQTTQEASLIARGVGGGNVASNFNTSSLYLADVKTHAVNDATFSGTSDTIMVNRFSAPGGFETNSEVFLDLYGKEKSVYNALPFRNLSVRGLGSGEEGTIRLVDIHGNRYGLLTHLTRHSAQFGIDSVLGGASASYHKVNRNPRWDAAEESYDYDNYWVQHHIPQSDYQYKWVNDTHTASLATSSLRGHILSGFTEPSGTVSRHPHEHLDVVVHSQSVINQRIENTTGYGFPTWEQIRNNDRNKNNILKKAYGFNHITTTILNNPDPSGSIIVETRTSEESRITENIPNKVNMNFQDTEYEFTYPYVNMKYHFDNIRTRQEFTTINNETLYDTFQGFYSNVPAVNVNSKSVNQIVFPRYIKHTKFFDRHRHFFKSHFWTDGENELYNVNSGLLGIDQTGSYNRVDEIGRRETNVTATLFGSESLNSQARYLVNDAGFLDNIIPSQSIWSMDSRTNFTSSNAHTAASNSAGAPGVLQNQDHHFHNGVSDLELLRSGSEATGSFDMIGATRFGQYASGSFTVQGMVPTGIEASGSFEITGANVQGTSGTGTFTSVGVYSPAASSSISFTAGERTVLGQQATGTFEVSGAHYPGTFTTGTFTLDGAYSAPVAASGGFTVEALPRFGERITFLGKFRDISEVESNTDYATSGVKIENIEFKTTNDSTSRTNDSTNRWIETFKGRKYLNTGTNGYLRRSTSFSGFDSGAGVTILFNMKVDQVGGIVNPSVVDTYRIAEFTRSTSTNKSVEILLEKTMLGVSLICRRYFDNNSTDYRQTKFTDFFTSANYGDNAWHSIKLTFNDSSSGAWNAYVDLDGAFSSKTTTTNGTITGNANDIAGYAYVGDVDSDFTLQIAELALYDSVTGVPSSTDYNNSGKWIDVNDLANTKLVSYWTFGNFSVDSTSIVYDIAENTNNNHLNSNVNTSAISFPERTDTTYISTNYRTNTEWRQAWETAFNTYLTASTVTLSDDRIQVRRTNLNYDSGYQNGIGLITINADFVNYNIYSPATILQASTDNALDSNSASEIVSNDKINVKGIDYQFRHASPIDEGAVYTFGSSPNTRLYQTQQSQAWRWNASTFQRNDLSNTSYSGFSSTSTDMTICIWIKPNNVGTSGDRHIINFWGDTGDSTPTDESIQIFSNLDDLHVRLYDSAGSNYKEYEFTSVLVDTRYQFLSIVIDRGNITLTPQLYIGETQQSSPSSTGTGTGVGNSIGSVFVGDHPSNTSLYEAQAAIAQISVWTKKMTSSDIQEVYNKGRYRNLETHPEFIDHCNDWWKFSATTDTSELPALNTNVATMEAAENTLENLASTPTTVSADTFTISTNNLSFSFTNATASINATYGIIKEGRMTVGGLPVNYTADTPVLWNELSASIESDSNVGDVTYTNNGDDADFLVFRNTAVADTSAITITQAGSTFSNAVAFNGYSAGSGLTSNSPSFATQIIIRKNNASGQVYEAAGNSDTSDYVFFQFRSGGSTTTLSSGYTTNPVLIDVTDFGTDAALWDHVVSAIGDHGATAVSCTRSGGDFTVTSDTAGLGKTYFITESDLGNHINSIINSGGTAPSGSSVGDRISIDGELFLLAATTDRSIQRIGVSDTTDSAVWDELKLQIDASSSFTVTSTSSAGNIATFNLQADITGTAENDVFSTAGSVSDSISITTNSEGGSNETGANENHYVEIYAIPGSNPDRYGIVPDKDNTNTNGQNYSASVAANGSTTIYVDSTRDSNADWWLAIHDALEAEGFDVSYTTTATQATYVVTNYVTGADGNGNFNPPYSGNGVTSGNTFSFVNIGWTPVSAFSGGVDATGAEDGDTITIHGETITITHGTQNLSSRIVDASGSSLTNEQYWEALRTCINANVSDVIATTGSDNPRTFTVTTTATGSSANPDISAETGTTFVITNAGTSGTDEAGAEDGDTITIDGSTFSIDITSGLGTGSTTNFHNALSQSIKDNTDFDTITITDLSNGFHRFSLTSSVTGTAKNVAFTQNTNGGRTTFQNLAGAAGGTSPIGIADLDRIKFADTEDTNPDQTYIFFNVDDTGGRSDSNTIKYIDITGYTGTDAEKSTQFWNDLSAAIKQHTAFDTITINESNNVATFSITSSVTGTAYNDDILQVYDHNSDGIGFTITNNTAGGTDETGASVGDTITIGSDTFTIVHNSSPTALQINASGVTDEEFFNAMSAAIKDQTDYDLVTWTSASNTASFALTSSTGDAGNNYAYSDPFTGESYATGSSFNVDITVSPSSNGTFQSPVGISGGTDGTFRNIKYQEIIPQPRYNYPHTLQSPGSMRCPTAKSNLGLIDVDYKLRSNHFALTRSLGFDTDGLYDNTSRWTTPDLSGLVPFDDDYNHYYERHRGQNKHFSLVPEFRISSHVKGIIDNGVDERNYFAKNWWLELTGTSFDNGSSMSKNYPKGSTESKQFLLEYSTTSRIRDIEKFIEENNTPETKLQPLKLTLTCEAINSFLPYEGFYPQTRTVQMCEAFAESYGKEIIAAEADPNDTTLEFPDNNVLAQTRPVFDAIMSPGLLYNTVKSGIAVDYPVVMSKMCTSSLKDPYGGVNHMIANEYFEDRLPFETLLSPESFMSKKMLVDMNPHPSSSLNLKAGIGNAADPNYKLMSNNFFAETLEFFMREGRTSRIVSAPESDPNFGVVNMLDNGKLPIYKAIFRVFKSKKRHPYIEFSGASDVISFSDSPDRAEDLYYNRPPSGTNYFLSEYAGLTGSALEYNTKETDYPRPNMNPYAEVETITMYSQPNAFGPPCAGGVAVEFEGRTGSGNADVITGEHNNTTYMMYDSTNGYNAPFTPPYYDGEAWAVYTFTPQRKGKHSLDEILQNTSIKFLRYEINHESGSFGDRGTFGPQGFTMNDNAMQVDASFNLFKKAVLEGAETTAGNQITTTQVPGDDIFIGQTIAPSTSGGRTGASWVIESKFETPILDFSKYLNRDYNATMESDTTTADIHTANISLSGSRQEPDTLSSIHSSLASVHKLSGTLNPIGMWHQYGDRPVDPNKGIFMQLVDMPAEYLRLGTEMTIPNPKWIVAKPNVVDCDGVSDALSTAYNEESRESMIPYVPKQENKRRMQGVDQFSVCGGALQIIDPATGLIIDTELDAEDLYASFGVAINDASVATTGSAVVDNFKLFDVFRDQSVYSKIKLTTSASFTGSSVNMMISRSGVDVSTDFTVSSSSPFKGHWAASYYHYDREDAYAPLLITTKNYEGLKYDYGDFSRGLFEDFLKDFSIGVPYVGQSARFGDGEDVRCTRYDGDSSRTDITVFAPSRFVDALEAANDALTITNLAKVDLTEASKTVVSGLLNRGITLGITEQTAEAKAVNTAKVSQNPVSTFKSIGTARKRFRLIPSISGLPASLASSDTSSYAYPEPMFVRGSIRYNAGAAVAGSAVTQRQIGYFNRMPQLAPQNDRNIATNPSTIRWGQFMHNNLEPRSVQSLARLVGFSNEPVKMGVVRKSRVLHEAVVAIPYILEASPTSQAVPKYLELDKMSVLAYMVSIGLITREQALERSADIVTQNEESNSASDSQQTTTVSAGEAGVAIAPSIPDLNPLNIDPSIAKQIDKMGKYVFPPHLDFINYDVQPLPMYIFEFTKHLDSQDLSDIWQGVRSENLKKVEMQTKTITHELSVESLLGSLKEENPDMTKLKDIRWRIFKVKQRGNTNYLDKMEKDLRKDGLSSTSGGNKDSTLNTKVGYNWPYDYFSLVENVKMKVNIDLGKVEEEPSEQGTGVGAIELGDPIQIVPNDSIQAGLIPGVLGVVEDEDEGDSTYSSTELATLDTTLLERIYDTSDESEDIRVIYTRVLGDFGTPTVGAGGGIDGDGQPDDPDIEQPDPLDEETDVQGSGGGSGYGGTGGGGVGQGNDGVDDDF